MKRGIGIAAALVIAALIGFGAGVVTESNPSDDAEIASESAHREPAPDAHSVRVSHENPLAGCKRNPRDEAALSCRELARMDCATGGIPQRFQGQALIGTRVDEARAQLRNAGCALRVVGSDDVVAPTDSELLRFRLNVVASDDRIVKVLAGYN